MGNKGSNDALALKIPEYQKNIQTKLLSVNDYFSAALSSVRTKAENVGRRVSLSELAGDLEGREERPQAMTTVCILTNKSCR